MNVRVAALICIFVPAGAVFAQKAAPNAAGPLPECAALTGQVLRCPRAGFTYKVQFGWVDRTSDMQVTGQSTATEKPGNEPEPAAESSSGRTLLAVFERPPGTQGDTINSAVIIAVEPQSSYPQVRTAADYLGALADLAGQRGLKMDGDPYLFTVGTKKLARADFIADGKARQSSLVLLERNFILSFTFLSSSDDEIDSLIENLAFTAGTKKPARK